MIEKAFINLSVFKFINKNSNYLPLFEVKDNLILNIYAHFSYNRNV